MANSEGPRKQDSRPPRNGMGRVLLWFAAMFAVGLGVWKLTELFPGQIASGWNQANLVNLLAILALVSSSLIFARRIGFGEAVRNLSIWTGLAAILVLGYSFQDELRDIGTRLRSELVPGYPVTNDPRELVLTRSANGQFYAMGAVNGSPVKFLIDTGASDIVLSPADAMRLGIDVKGLDFAREYQTANGVGRGASVTLPTLSVGPVELRDVKASVNQADMSESLLGLSFLERLGSVEFQGRRLYLRLR